MKKYKIYFTITDKNNLESVVSLMKYYIIIILFLVSDIANSMETSYFMSLMQSHIDLLENDVSQKNLLIVQLKEQNKLLLSQIKNTQSIDKNQDLTCEPEQNYFINRANVVTHEKIIIKSPQVLFMESFIQFLAKAFVFFYSSQSSDKEFNLSLTIKKVEQKFSDSELNSTDMAYYFLYGNQLIAPLLCNEDFFCIDHRYSDLFLRASWECLKLCKELEGVLFFQKINELFFKLGIYYSSIKKSLMSDQTQLLSKSLDPQKNYMYCNSSKDWICSQIAYISIFKVQETASSIQSAFIGIDKQGRLSKLSLFPLTVFQLAQVAILNDQNKFIAFKTTKEKKTAVILTSGFLIVIFQLDKITPTIFQVDVSQQKFSGVNFLNVKDQTYLMFYKNLSEGVLYQVNFPTLDLFSSASQVVSGSSIIEIDLNHDNFYLVTNKKGLFALKQLCSIDRVKKELYLMPQFVIYNKVRFMEQDEEVSEILFANSSKDILIALSNKDRLFLNNIPFALNEDSIYHFTRINTIPFLFITSKVDTNVYLINGYSKEYQKLFSGHAKDITAIYFNCFKNQLITAAKDCTIKIWNMETQQPIQTILVEKAITSLYAGMLFLVGISANNVVYTFLENPL